VKTLRVALRDALPEAQEQRLGRILKEKGGAQYGARASRIEDAVRLLAELEALAAWAEAELNKSR
jgi:hypothetical protein